MAGGSIAAWLSRLTAGELLRAYRVQRVAHGDAYLTRRRYLSDGTIMETSGVSLDADEGNEHPVGHWTDIDLERRRLRSAGWDVAGPTTPG